MSDLTYAKASTQQKASIGFSPTRSLLQRTCACGQHTLADGECEACRNEHSTPLRSQRSLKSPSTATFAQGHEFPVNSESVELSSFGHDFSRIPVHFPQQLMLQTKLTINQPGDVYEQEADQMAEQVMRMADSSAAISDEEDEAKNSLMRKQANEPGADVATQSSVVPAIVHDVLNDGRGQPLDAETRAFMEPRFGHDFSQVRVHTDTQAAESARTVNALAYTVGRDVVFGAGLYAPNTRMGQKLIAHELMHTIQQQNSQLAMIDFLEHECKAEAIAHAVYLHRPIPILTPMQSGLVSRQKLQPDESPKIEHNFEIVPQLFRKPREAPAVTKGGECEEFPGGSTDCEVNEKTGTPTGKVTKSIDETNPCTKPCVEQHEAVHVKQMKTFCPELRDCYLSADKGKRPAIECAKMAIFGRNERECLAYKVSVPCIEKRLKNAKECQSKENKAYGERKLASEKCFRNKNCGGSA